MRRKAFTVIELLVVIGIIALLAALLFPVFTQARNKARQAVCTSNLRQVAMAVKQYVQDHDERYFPAPYSAEVGGRRMALGPPNFLFPYVKSGGVFQCPSEPQDLDLRRWLEDTPANGGCFGGRLGAWPGSVRYSSCSPNRALFGRLLSEAPRPSETSVFFDGYLICGGSPPAFAGVVLARPGRAPRHQEGLNVSYVDGHIGYRKARLNASFTFLGDRGWWVMASGPYAGRMNLIGSVMDDGTVSAP